MCLFALHVLLETCKLKAKTYITCIYTGYLFDRQMICGFKLTASNVIFLFYVNLFVLILVLFSNYKPKLSAFRKVFVE